MRASDIAATVVTTLFGIITGFLVAGGPTAVVGALLGAGIGIVAGRANVRPAITMTVFVGAMTGVLVGASIVETICLPGSCVGLELVSGAVVGAASFVGVGLVAALVTRSFEEYRDSVDEGRPPPTPGCEAEPEAPEGDQPA